MKADWITRLILLIGILAFLIIIVPRIYPAELEATGEVTTGWSNAHENPFVGVHLSGRINGFTLYGGSRIDLMQAQRRFVQPSFAPMRSVYSIGLKYEWRFLEETDRG